MKIVQIAAGGAALVLSASAFAAEVSPACKPVLLAMEKSLSTDHATSSTQRGRTVQAITVGGVMYVQVGGAWRKSPVTVQSVIEQSRENLRDAKEFTCRPLADSIVDGVAVANYATHTVTDSNDDGMVAIDKRTGLAVRVENHLTGDADAHYVTRYTYGNVKAPI